MSRQTDISENEIEEPPEMSEREERAMLMDEWNGILAQLWTSIGKEVDCARLLIYGKALGAVPMGLLEKVVARVMRENTYMMVPPVGTIWAAVRKELWDPFDLDAAIERWHPDFPMGYRVTPGGWEPIYD